MCHSGNKQPAQQRQVQQSRSRNRSNRRNQYGRRLSGNQGQAGQWGRNHNVYSIQNHNSDDPDLVDFENLTCDTIDVIQCDSVGRSHNHCNEVFVSLRIRVTGRPGEHILKAKVDTGAQGNSLPLRTFRGCFLRYCIPTKHHNLEPERTTTPGWQRTMARTSGTLAKRACHASSVTATGWTLTSTSPTPTGQPLLVCLAALLVRTTTEDQQRWRSHSQVS